jgi:hypothetical protein
LTSGLVLDVSVTLTWCFEDEMTPVGRHLFIKIADRPIVVPAL